MKFIPKGVSRTMSRQILKTQKNSPTILFVAGVTGVVTATVLACRATLHVDNVLRDAELNREDAKKIRDGGNTQASEETYVENLRHIKVTTSVAIVKAYAPSVGLTILSIAALTKSHNILTTRNAALTATVAGLERAFAEYQKRVVEEVGEDRELEIRYGAEEVTKTIEDKNGPKKVKALAPGPKAGYSPYARFFDETNVNWNGVAGEYNVMFITLQQNWANDKLHARGHLFLNEVYEELGLSHTQAGSQMGWILGHGDDFVDFGHFDSDNPRAREFVNGQEPAILLDFNVVQIWDKI
jgi:hypothetical protein